MKQRGQDLVVTGLQDFILEQTLECGQCFHFELLGENEYGVVAYGKLLHIKQINQELWFYDTTRQEYDEIWESYFDLTTDYGQIKSFLLSKDQKLKNAIDEMKGVRILRQELFENLISFIISQNKQIPHIKKIVATLSEKYGTYLGTIKEHDFYAFPTAQQMKFVTEQELRECKTGFRAPYIVDAVEKVLSGVINIDELRKCDLEQCESRLTSIKGVGVKVANCVMLFSIGKTEAFPIDVWIKRVMEAVYYDGKATDNKEIARFAREQFGNYGGYAQQYLFYYGKTIKLGVKAIKDEKK